MERPGENANPGSTEDALARLRGRVSQMRAAETAARTELGPASHPLADLARLSAFLRNSEFRAHEMPEATEALPGPATIAIFAEKLGLDVYWDQIRVDTLDIADLPVVVLLRNGESRLVIARRNRKTFTLLGKSGEQDVSLEALSAAASGTLFRVKAAGLSAGKAPTPAITTQAAPQGTPQATSRPIMALLLNSLRGQTSHIAHLCLATILIHLLSLALPLFSMAVFDRVIPHGAMDTLWALALGVGLALMLELALRNARLKLFDAVGLCSGFLLQSRLTGRLFFARMDDVPKSGGALVPASQELDTIAMIAPQLLVGLLVDLPFFMLLLLLISTLGGPVVLAPLVGALVLISVHVIFHVLAQRNQGTHLKEMRRQMQLLLDSVAGIERIRTTGAGKRFVGLWERVADASSYAAHRNRYWHGLSAQLGAVLVQAVVVATVVIGVFRIDAAGMTIGALSACTLLASRALIPLSVLLGLAFRLMQGLENVAPLDALLQAPPEGAGDERSASQGVITGKIDLHRISFQYPGEARMALREISFSVRPGEKIGLIGKAGCGKSTILKLIARLSEPVDGRIGVDDRDIRQHDPMQLRRALSYMPQDAQLLDLSLYDNLTIGLPAVDQEQFARVTKLCGVHDFASTHPAGYSMPVGPGGQRLSGGERQAVSLARALMGRPSLLMLDEPTSSMDNGLEARIVADLKRDLGDMGLIVATHRLPVLALVDRIIWLDGGRVVADGPKEQIFAKLGMAA